MRAVTGFVTRNGRFFEREADACRAQLVEDLKNAVWEKHRMHLTGIAELLLDYILDTYTLVKKK